MKNLVGLGLLIVMAIGASGCAFFRADKIHYVYDENISPACSDCGPAIAGDSFVGIALSGGGARASVFGASAIEALSENGIMAHATHISSVSGGGFPAAFYAIHFAGPCAETDSPVSELCASADFAEFKAAMRHNFLNDMTLRQLARPGRITSPTRRLLSLRDALDNQITDHTAFGDLPPLPVLLINGARYDDARRFVFSTQPIPEAPSGIAPFTEQTLRTASFSRPGCPRPTPADFSVGLAVAISAGFPPLLGPAAIEANERCDGGDALYWHIGDGGILDNTGVETLEDFALHADHGADAIKRVIIFSFDAGRSTDADVMMRTRSLNLWTSDPGRVVDIVGKRAEAYRQVALEEHYAASGTEFLVLRMRYTDARVTTWPTSCGERSGGAPVISAYLATIPTNFKITDCDADLMELAARDLVERTIEEHRSTLVDAGLIMSR